MHATAEKADDRSYEPSEEEPKLQMQRHDVRRAHEMKARSLEGRNEWWIGRARQLSEELMVEAAEEVDRLCLGNPERPAVEFVQPGEAP